MILAQLGAKMAQHGVLAHLSTGSQDGPQDGPRLGPKTSTWSQNGTNLDQLDPNLAPTWPQLGP
eukprot:161953-Karenia_brevis.AAC.1